MASLDDLIKKISYPSKEKIDLITKAYYFAEKAHAGQFRYSGEPYFNHSFETAMILANLGMGRRTISAGLLHDVLEDTDITHEKLRREFGKEITFLVDGVTKLGSIHYFADQKHIDSLKKFFIAMSLDIRVLIIKLADRLHNMRTLEYVPQDKRKRIAQETMEIYVPLAYRLGIRSIKREMEDLAFKHIEPEQYISIKSDANDRLMAKRKFIERFRRSLLKLLAKEGIKDVISDTRIKSIYSLYHKTKIKNKDIEKIYDIQALRLNVNTAAECYKILGLIHSKWRPLPGRIKDYIAFPKPNGYQSLHTTVLTGQNNALEIQIRTHQMHENAEYGLAAHISYKENNASRKSDLPYNKAWINQFFPKNKKRNTKIDKQRAKHIPSWIKDLVDIQSYITVPTEFMDNLKADFFKRRMFIFDSDGKEVIDLPIGSSVIDYAYAMDNELGNRLHRALVNNRSVGINTILNNGDTVDILTNKNARPSEKWLEYCNTNLAKNLIREAINSKTKK